MGHLHFDETGRVRKGTPDAWLPVAAQVSEYARKFSGRGDVIANVGPDIGGPYNTACWSPLVADMDVNTETCLPGYTPARVDFRDEIFQLGALPFVGAVTHEAAHARWTCWVPAQLAERSKAGAEKWTQATVEVVIALEESRIETLAVMKDPSKRAALAQCALSIVLKDFKVNNTLFGASISLALTVGRYALLSADEVDRFRALVEPHLPRGLMPRLESLIREYHRLPQPLAKNGVPNDAFFAEMHSIAERWLIAIRETAAEIKAEEDAKREAAAAALAEDDEDADTPADDEPEDGDESERPETDRSADEDEDESDDAYEGGREPDEDDEHREGPESGDGDPGAGGTDDGAGAGAGSPSDEGAGAPGEDAEDHEDGEPSEDAEEGSESDDLDGDDDSDADGAEGGSEPSEDAEDADDVEVAGGGESEDGEDDSTDVREYEALSDDDEPADDEGVDDDDAQEEARRTEEEIDATWDRDGGDEDDETDAEDEGAPESGAGSYGGSGSGGGGAGEGEGEPAEPARDMRDEQPDLRSGIPGEDEETGQTVIVITFTVTDEDDDSGFDDEPADDPEDTLGDEIREAAGEAAMEREAEALDERAEKVAERRVEDKRIDHKRKVEAHNVLDERHGEDSHDFERFCRSHKLPARTPEPGERVAANRLAATLERITFHDRAVTKVDRVLPGGKLRPRAAVAKAADRDRGGRAEVPIWRAKERRHTAETPVTVGILTDVSGSMSYLAEPSAVTTYVVSQAVGTIEGKVATATFGNEGYLVNRAYERTPKVQPWAAKDGIEAFREGALLLDAELTLLDGDGARILIIFTDAQLVNGEDATYAATFMRLCKQKNVAVIWCSYDEDPVQNFGYGAMLNLTGTPADIANTLGAAILTEVSKVEASRGA